MYSLLEAASKEPTSAPTQAHPPAAGLDRSGGTSIIAGCYLAGANTRAPAPGLRSTGAGAGAAPSATFAAEGPGASPALLGADNSSSRKRARPGAGAEQTVAGPQRNDAKGRQSYRASASRRRTEDNGWDPQQWQRQPLQPFQDCRTTGINAAPTFASSGVSSHDVTDTDGKGSGLFHPSAGERFGVIDATVITTGSPAGEEPRTDGVFSNTFDDVEEYRVGGPAEPADPELLGPPLGTSENTNPTVDKSSAVPVSLRVAPGGSDLSFRTPGPTSFLTSSSNVIDEDSATRLPAAHQQTLSGCSGAPATRMRRHRHQEHEGADTLSSSGNRHHKPYHKRSGNAQATHSSPFLSRQLDGIFSAYSNHGGDGAPTVPSTSTAANKREPKADKGRGGKRARGGGGGGGDGNKKKGVRTKAGVQAIQDATGSNCSTARWKHGGNTAPAITAARAAERTRQLEALMNAAMESPITYEEQIRRERLAHLRMMYTMEKEMAELPVDFLRDIGYEECGIKPRLSRMCAALGKSHRWSKRTAISRLARALEKARADKFADEMLRYEHSRLFATLSSAKARWELKQTRRRFLAWRKRVRLARIRSLQRGRPHPPAMGAETASLGPAAASPGAKAAKEERSGPETLVRTLRLMEEKRRYEAIHRAATALQDAWLRHVGRCQILEYAEEERQELNRRRRAERARRWAVMLPMAQSFLSDCLDRSRRAVLAKLRAEHETLRLAYEADLAEHRRRLDAAHARIAHAWRGKRVRLEFLERMSALKMVQKAWTRAVSRRKLQAEIDARCAATAERLKQARHSAAVRLQAFAINRARRHQLNKRFAARKAKLDFERRNRSELASACLVMFRPRQAIRDAAGPEDFESMGEAVRPAAAVARLRASAAARGVSLSEMSGGGTTSDAVGSDDDEEAMAMKRLSGSELARAVLKQQEAQGSAALALQLAWRKRKARLHLDDRFAKRKVKIIKERRENTALRVQRMWASSKLRAEVAARVEKTRARIEAQRDWGSRRLQRLCRRRRDAKELASRFAIRKIILEQEKSLREMMAAASKIQGWYRRRRGVYYATLRIVARYQLAYKRAVCAREEYLRRREEAAVVVQLARRRRAMRAYLSRRFEARRARIAAAKEATARDAAATTLQGWWRRRQARVMLHGRFAKRARVMVKKAEEEERARLEDAAARVLQRAWTRHCEWEKMRLRFRLRRKVLNDTFALEESKRLELEHLAKEKLEEERRLQREHEATKVKLLLEEAEKKRKADEAADHLLKAWKIGYDQDHSRNYWFNHVTGESSLERPEGWVIKPSERWLKQSNDKGLVYYLDLETGESHWFPPCEQCYKREGEKVCMGCKEDLNPGERHCVDCGFRKAKWVCLQCKDALCGECNARIHGSGHRKNHQVESYAKSKKGWQTVEGRTDNEPTYYFNASTGESTFDKPQDLMLPEELMEHKRFLEFKEISEKYVKKIEKLQFQLEELMYEKDKIAYQWANAQKDMKTTGGGDKGGGLSLGGLKRGGGGKKKGKEAAAGGDPRTPEQEEAYKKSLLISRKDKKDMGFEVKLKKETMLDS
eukprot:g5617.t1